MRFREAAKPYKPIENWLFRVTENQCQKPYKTNCISAPFAPESGKALQNIEKALPAQGFRNASSGSRETL